MPTRRATAPGAYVASGCARLRRLAIATGWAARLSVVKERPGHGLRGPSWGCLAYVLCFSRHRIDSTFLPRSEPPVPRVHHTPSRILAAGAARASALAERGR